MEDKDRDKRKDIRIAVPTNDEVTIFPKMLGMAEKMFVYELSEDHIKLLEKRTNPYAKTQQHLKTLDVYDLLHDCVIIISAHIGPLRPPFADSVQFVDKNNARCFGLGFFE